MVSLHLNLYCFFKPLFVLNFIFQVQDGVDAFLFQLLVLGCLGHSSGHVWRKTDLDYYIIESMPLLIKGSDSKVIYEDFKLLDF